MGFKLQDENAQLLEQLPGLKMKWEVVKALGLMGEDHDPFCVVKLGGSHGGNRKVYIRSALGT